MRRIALASLVLGATVAAFVMLRPADETNAADASLAEAPTRAEPDRTVDDRLPGNRPSSSPRGEVALVDSASGRMQFAPPPSSFESPEMELAWYQYALESARERSVRVAGLRERIDASDPPAPEHVRDGIARDQAAVEARIKELEQHLDQLEGTPKRPAGPP